MSAIGIENLLVEVNPELPCGEDLEYDPEFSELENSVRTKSEQQFGDTIIESEGPNWGDVQQRSLDLFSRTKDLRVTVYLIRSLVHTNGIFGLRDGLALLKALLERFWDSIHPGLDPSDREDPIMRLNALNGLADYNSILVSVKSAPLVDTRGIGQFSLRDIEGADDPDKPGPSMSDIGAAFMGCDLEDLKATKEAVDEAIAFVAAIEHVYGEHVGEGNSLGLDGLIDQLRAIQVALADRLAQRGVDEKLTDGPGANAGMSVDAGDGARPTTDRIGGINGHSDVVRALDAICEYYRRYEPSSPVPLLLRRAKRLVAKGFMEILRDIAPDGTSQAELIRGAEEETDERD